MAIPTETLLAIFAIFFGTLALIIGTGIFLLVKLIRSILRDRYEYEANFSTRFAAFFIDIAAITILIMAVKGILGLNGSDWFQYGIVIAAINMLYVIFLTLFYIALSPLFIIYGYVIWFPNISRSVNFFYFYFVNNFVLPHIIAFGYFFASEWLLEGSTIGKKLLGIKSVSGKEDKPIIPKDAAILALVKSFFLLPDVIIGRFRIENSRTRNTRQFRLTQQITNIKVVRKKIPPIDSVREDLSIAVCSNCGCRILPNATFCVNCGKSVKSKTFVREEPVREEPVREEPVREEPVREEPVREEPVREEPVREEYAISCLECGYRLPPNVRFCVNCGKQLGSE